MKIQKRAAKSDPNQLTPLEEKFVKEYLIDLNGTQALVRAGGKYKNLNSAAAVASEWLGKPRVQKVLTEEFNARNKKTEVNVEFVLKELLQIANCDILEAYDNDQCLRKLSDMPVHVRKAISSVKCDEIWEIEYEGKKKIKTQVGITKEVRFWDKKGSLELLGKYLAMFVERQRQEGADGQPLPAVQVHIHKHIASPIALDRTRVVQDAT